MLRCGVSYIVNDCLYWVTLNSHPVIFGADEADVSNSTIVLCLHCMNIAAYFCTRNNFDVHIFQVSMSSRVNVLKYMEFQLQSAMSFSYLTSQGAKYQAIPKRARKGVRFVPDTSGRNVRIVRARKSAPGNLVCK